MATSTEPGDSGNLAQSARAKPMDCANGKTPRSPAYPWFSDMASLLKGLTAAERLRLSFAHALVSAGKTAGKITMSALAKKKHDGLHTTIRQYVQHTYDTSVVPGRAGGRSFMEALHKSKERICL